MQTEVVKHNQRSESLSSLRSAAVLPSLGHQPRALLASKALPSSRSSCRAAGLGASSPALGRARPGQLSCCVSHDTYTGVYFLVVRGVRPEGGVILQKYLLTFIWNDLHNLPVSSALASSSQTYPDLKPSSSSSPCRKSLGERTAF